MDRGAWWAMVHRVWQRADRLKRLSTHALTLCPCETVGITENYDPEETGRHSCDTLNKWENSLYILSLQSEIKPKGKKAIRWHRNHKEIILKNKIAVIVLNISMNF